MNHQTRSQTESGRLLGARRLALPWILWVFGLSTTLLLVGLWGRAVTVDHDAIGRSTRAALSTDVVTDRVYDLIGDGLVGATGISEEEAGGVVDEIRHYPEAEAAMDALVDDVVSALIASPGGDMTVDVAEALSPLVPSVVDELSRRGVDVPRDEVESAVDSIDPVALDGGATIPVGTVTEQARAVLTRGVVIAASILAIAGALAVGVSEERWSMIRSLATRIAFSALSFAALFRLGGWALDPDGGRSPLRRSGAILVGSNLDVFLVVAGLAGILAAAIWIVRGPRSVTVSRSRMEDDTVTAGDETSTQELVQV